jgi:hypothetical protein
MHDRFAEKMTDKRARSDTRLLGDFTAMYCRGNHHHASRAPLESPGVELGVYGRRVPVVCDDCAELVRYAEKRRAFCPKRPKPFCNDCDTHCYSPEMRERVRLVMRYSGPRSMLTRHALAGVKHLIEGRRARMSAAPAAKTTKEECR